MGIAHGFASTVMLRAESPVYAGVLRQSNAFWGGLRHIFVIVRGQAGCHFEKSRQ
jgi:hypothetical protein